MKAHFETTISIGQEHIPVRGNAMASDDAAFNRECEDEILARLDAGDLWAWCTVRVRVWCGDLYEDEYLGCCSYRDEAEFRDGGYFEDMEHAARERLIENARAVLTAAGEYIEHEANAADYARDKERDDALTGEG